MPSTPIAGKTLEIVWKISSRLLLQEITRTIESLTQHVRIWWSDALHLNGEQALKRKLLGPGKHRVGHYTATHRLSNSMRNSYGRATCGRTTSGRTTGRTAVRSIIILLQMVVRLLETFEFLRFDANHLANDQTNFKWLSSGAFWLQREFRCLHNALLNSLVPRVPLQSVCQLFFKLCPFQTVCPRGHFEVSPKCPQSGWAHHRNSSKKTEFLHMSSHYARSKCAFKCKLSSDAFKCKPSDDASPGLRSKRNKRLKIGASKFAYSKTQRRKFPHESSSEATCAGLYVSISGIHFCRRAPRFSIYAVSESYNR